MIDPVIQCQENLDNAFVELDKKINQLTQRLIDLEKQMKRESYQGEICYRCATTKNLEKTMIDDTTEWLCPDCIDWFKENCKE